MMKYPLSADKINRAFSKAARHYDEVAILQQEIATRLLERLQYMKITPSVVLNIGCRTGQWSQSLAQLYPSATIFSLSISTSMLQCAKKQNTVANGVCFDPYALPFANDSVDLVFSNLFLHWCAHPNNFLKEIHRVLRADGVLLFSTLGPDSLQELRASWAEVDDKPHVHHFADMHDIGDCLLQNQFADPVMDMEVVTFAYKEVENLIQDLKTTGTHNLHLKRRRQLTGKKRFCAFKNAYQQFRASDGSIPATFEVIYGHAWGIKQLSGFSANNDGEVHIPIELVRPR